MAYTDIAIDDNSCLEKNKNKIVAFVIILFIITVIIKIFVKISDNYKSASFYNISLELSNYNTSFKYPNYTKQ
jgi:hypothetical protein